MDFELVTVMDLVVDDRILLDNGQEYEVKSTKLGRHKDQMIINLRRLGPLYVNGYWNSFIRRTFKAVRAEQKER